MPSRSPTVTREEQLEDPELKKIIDSFSEPTKNEENARWLSRGYLISSGVLYRYSPDIDAEEPQLVIPQQEKAAILREYHDNPTAGHYGLERTWQRISSRYYWVGMRRDIAEHTKNCLECQRYKADNLKPAGLIQTPIMKQRFEALAIDLFGPLPQSLEGYKWVFAVEDTASRWTELFPLETATAEACATVLINEVMLRYGIPRRIISDNGSQFVSAVMQHVTYCFGIQQDLIPVYHPAANPVERKNRDLKVQLAILSQGDHSKWPDKIPSIRFAMNSAFCSTTGYSAAQLTFGRELRTPDEAHRDLRTIVQNENFVPEITPKLPLGNGKNNSKMHEINMLTNPEDRVQITNQEI